MSSVCSMGFELFYMRISLVNTTYKQCPAVSVRNIISIYVDNLLNGIADRMHDRSARIIGITNDWWSNERFATKRFPRSRMKWRPVYRVVYWFGFVLLGENLIYSIRLSLYIQNTLHVSSNRSFDEPIEWWNIVCIRG